MKTTDILNIAGVAYKLYPHEETFDAQHLAAALRVPGHNVGKTVLLRADSGFAHIVAVLPATRTLDLRRVSDALGGADVQLATEVEIAEHCPDFEFGLLPPFGGKFGMKTIVDASLAQHEDIFFQGNSHTEAIRMRYSDFAQIEHPLVVDIVSAVPEES
ncbi:MAG: YbaK/EbsC family protein [Pirellulales bacterium]